MCASSYSSIAMQGYMMKKKGDADLPSSSSSSSSSKKSRRSLFKRKICLKWVTRYFILFDDGRFVYYKDRPPHISKDGTTLCENIGECTIDRVSPADLMGDPKLVNNSFYVTRQFARGGVGGGGKTLLVTNGPEEYRRWIFAFRKLKAGVPHSESMDALEGDVDDNVPVASISVEKETIAADTVESAKGDVPAVESSAVASPAAECALPSISEHASQEGQTPPKEKEDFDLERKKRLTAELMMNVRPKEEEDQEAAVVIEPESLFEEMGRLYQEERDKIDEEERIEADRQLQQEGEEKANVQDAVGAESAKEVLELPQSREEGREGSGDLGVVSEAVPKEQSAEPENVEQDPEPVETVQPAANDSVGVEAAADSVENEAEGGGTPQDLGDVAEKDVGGQDSASEEQETAPESDIEEGGDVTKEENEGAGTGDANKVDAASTEDSAAPENDISAEDRTTTESYLALVNILSENDVPAKKDGGNSGVEELDPDKGGVSADSPLQVPNDDEDKIASEEEERNEGEEKNGGESQSAEIGEEKEVNHSFDEVEVVEEVELKKDGEKHDAMVAAPAAEAAAIADKRANDKFLKMTEAEIGARAKVFAYGITFDHFESSLDPNKALFGVFVTSLDVMVPSHAPALGESTPALTAFSLECEGESAPYEEVTRFKNHLHEIKSFCKKHVVFDKIHPLVYSGDGAARGQMLRRLGAPESGNRNEMEKDEKKQGEAPLKTSFKGQQQSKERSTYVSIYSDTQKTEYKRALEELGADNVPSGDDILKIIRQSMGFPYNWVLFEPSKSELVVEDAGSGGVMEVTKLLQEVYNDRLLFGLLRLSFSSGEFGRRQFWVGLDWKGEGCSSVKAMRQLRECLDPMSKMIGDRSFTLSNVAASELTPEMFVERVTRSCNVSDFDVTVATMKNAHVEEQDALRRLEEERAERERKKREEEEAGLRRRRAKIEGRWCNMGATEILQDMGNDDVCGWVLLEF